MGRRGAGPRWPLALSAKQQEAMQAQGYTGPGSGAPVVVAAPAKPVKAKRGAHGGVSGQVKSTRSQAERDYEVWAALRPSVMHVQPHPVAIKLPAATTKGYTPDLAVRYVDKDRLRVDDEARPDLLPIDFVEVKGTKDGRPRYTEAARLRTLAAAQAIAPLGFRIVTAWRVDKVWHHEVVPIRVDA